MEPTFRLIAVALLSIVLGYIFSNTAAVTGIARLEAAGSVLAAAPIPVSLPVIQPSISYRVVLIRAPDRFTEPPRSAVAQTVDQTEADLLDQSRVDPPLTGEEFDTDLPDINFVASLKHDGATVDEGFDALEPGTLTRMTWKAGESLYGSSIPTPILVAEGSEPGLTLCLTAAVHGDELNGIETVRRVMYSLNPEKLKGRVIGVPIVNLQGFERHSRYLPDRRDLNRFFPGNPRGSSASRIAYSLFEDVIRHCSALVDLHTGSFHRTNLPQLRANLDIEEVVELTEGFGATVVLHSTGGVGTLRHAAVAAGIPTVTLEAGEPLRVDDRSVEHSVKALFSLMDRMKMYDRRSFWGTPEPTYYSSLWVRADKGGILLSKVKLGKRVKAGDLLGTVTDPITNEQQQIVAPDAGRIIGMALNQFVMPGYAAFHLGIEAPSVEALPDVPDDDHIEISHSIAQFNELVDERDDSDE